MRARRFHLVGTALFWLIASARLLGAGAFRVAPVRIDLSIRHPHSTLEVSNLGDQRVTLQVGTFVWQVDQGADRLQDTDDILVNPPIFTLDPGSRQLLRLGLREWMPGDTEKPYRIILEEVPPTRLEALHGIQTLLRISIPLFVQPAAGVHPQLVWSANRSTDGSLVLSVENVGKQHTRVRRFSVSAEGHPEPDFVMPTPTYLLPGTKRLWTINGTRIAGASELDVQAQTEGAELDATTSVRIH
jgi:fimbrial chaperone protein